MNDEKKVRYFIRNADAGEPWAYCGDDSDRGGDHDAMVELNDAYERFKRERGL